MQKIILASQSPRRLELLKNMGLEVIVIPSHIEEINHWVLSPEDYTLELARAKCDRVRSSLKKEMLELPIIAADTIVVLDNEIIEKPNDKEHARAMLQKLSARTHRVVTGYMCYYHGKECTKNVSTLVTFKTLHDHEIDSYIVHDEPYDKAGAYAIQGYGAFMIESINGSYTNVVGLPLSHVIEDLSSLGFSLWT